MHLQQLGWDDSFAGNFKQISVAGFVPARVIEQMKGFYRVSAEPGEYLADLAGRMRHLAANPEDLPAVGDWVAIAVNSGSRRARIGAILPRRTQLARKAASREVRAQIIATNLDTVFIVTAANQEFNLRRIERYISAVWDGGAKPVILLNKADLCRDALVTPQELAAQLETAFPGVAVYALSALEGRGLEALWVSLAPAKTAAFVGSSGVGKSTNQCASQHQPGHSAGTRKRRSRTPHHNLPANDFPSEWWHGNRHYRHARIPILGRIRRYPLRF